MLGVQIRQTGKTLNRLCRQVAVRHRMAYDDRALPQPAQIARDRPTSLAFARPCPCRTDSYNRFRRCQHRLIRPQQPKTGTCRHHAGTGVHHMLIRNIAVTEQHEIDLALSNQPLQLLFGKNRNARRVQRTRQAGRIVAVFDVGNLGRCKGNDRVVRVVTKKHIEVVEISPGCPQNQHPLCHHTATFLVQTCSADGLPLALSYCILENSQSHAISGPICRCPI